MQLISKNIQGCVFKHWLVKNFKFFSDIFKLNEKEEDDNSTVF